MGFFDRIPFTERNRERKERKKAEQKSAERRAEMKAYRRDMKVNRRARDEVQTQLANLEIESIALHAELANLERETPEQQARRQQRDINDRTRQEIKTIKYRLLRIK